MAQTTFTKLAIAILAGFGLTAFSLPAFAQTNTVNPLEDLKPRDGSSDPFSSTATSSSIMDLMHQLQRGNIRSMEQFSTDQGQNILDAAADFRKQQQMELMRQGNNGEIAPFPPTSNP